ncbi:RidA family protein [Larkinella arboricola]|uniref:Enamine deaminase RidA (YjgF/YER057c/UK114 family) n=1 Tax=Larkinella arboricola TaxID=643671 RepID=A0A327X4D0_LARAB|nr:RidA family protein [Larkinella arboricola]RAK00194.1 enamine deaminase RidA (YjgF/YER057c/UK114 family) [Larkinella arboricola]
MKKFCTAFAIGCFLSAGVSFGQSVEAKLKEQGITLDKPTASLANYVKAVRTGNLVFLSGHVSNRADGTGIKGKLGKELSVEQGYEAAKLAAIGLLSSLKAEIGNLDKVKRVVKVLGMVNSTPEFADQPKVVNGCSDLMVKAFGDKGKHARSAVGVAALPSDYAVEVEMIVEVE